MRKGSATKATTKAGSIVPVVAEMEMPMPNMAPASRANQVKVEKMSSSLLEPDTTAPFATGAAYAAAAPAPKKASKWQYECNMGIQLIGVQSRTPLAWSPDGIRLAFVAGNNSIYLRSYDDTKKQFLLEKILGGHNGRVITIIFHPRNPNLFISSAEDEFIVWDIAEGKAAKMMKTDAADFHDDSVLCMCWTHGGDFLATGSGDSEIKIWKTADNFSLVETIFGHKAPVMALEWNRDVGKLASASRDSTVKIWNTHTLDRNERGKRNDDQSINCKILSTLDGHRGDVISLEFIEEGTLLITGARDNSMKIWSMTSFTEMRDLRDVTKGHQGHHNGDVQEIVHFAHPTTGNTQVFSASMDSSIMYFDMNMESLVEDSMIDYRVGGTAAEEADLSSDMLQKLLMGSSVEEDTSVLAGDSLLERKVAHPHEGCASMALNPTYRWLATSSTLNCVRIWELPPFFQRPKLMQEFVGHMSTINDVKVLGAGNKVLTCSLDYRIHLYDIKTMNLIQKFNFDSSVLTVDVNPPANGHTEYIFAGGVGYDIKVFSQAQHDYLDVYNHYQKMGQTPPCWAFEMARLTGHCGKVTAVAVDPTGLVLASGSEDCSIFLWPLKFKQDGRAYASPKSTSMEHHIPVVETNHTNDYHSGHVTDLKFCNGTIKNKVFLCSCSADHSVVVWEITNISNGRPGFRKVWENIDGHSAVVSGVCWGREGNVDTIFSCGWDKVILAWSLKPNIVDETVEPIAILSGHTGRICQVETTLDGRYLASASMDSKVLLWQSSGDFECLCCYRCAEAVVACATSNGALVSTTDNGMIQVWPIPEIEDGTLQESKYSRMFRTGEASAATGDSFYVLDTGSGGVRTSRPPTAPMKPRKHRAVSKSKSSGKTGNADAYGETKTSSKSTAPKKSRGKSAAPAASAAAPPQMMVVTVPKGVVGGQSLTVNLGNRQVNVMVPAGMVAGQQFQMQVA